MGPALRGPRGWLLVAGLCVGAALGAPLAQGAVGDARATCLANLTRLAQATLMYVADNDGRFPPQEAELGPYECQWGADNANPWLRWPVLLERYLPDRAHYLCPALDPPPEGRSVIRRPSWIASEPITTKGWPDGPCGLVYPPGWGGAITDSATQGRCTDPDRFAMSYGAAIGALAGRRLLEVEHPERHLVWADAARTYVNLGSILYANACRVDCADRDHRADWENCPWSQECGAGGDFATNPEVPPRFTRHQGGSNLAFVDGHARWMSVADMIAAYREGRLLGVEPARLTEGEPWYLK